MIVRPRQLDPRLADAGGHQESARARLDPRLARARADFPCQINDPSPVEVEYRVVWFKVDDLFAGHKKARQAQLEAIGMWTAGGSHSANQLDDGHVDEWFVETWKNGRRAADRLVKTGLWHAPGHTCADCPPIDEGWIFHQWGQRNPLAEQVLAQREAAAERQRRSRDTRSSNRSRHGVTATVTDTEVTPIVRRQSHDPDPTRPEGEGGSTKRERYESYPRDPDEPPPADRCPLHTRDPHPPACGACRDARLRSQAWQAKRDQAAAAEQARHRARAIADCQLCDRHGRTATDAVCNHNPDQQRINARGRAALDHVRETLTTRERSAG